ncbi:CCR4-NOT core subunit NOT3 [Sporobolomyces koalae]|uniref:CCR4-NOT core subunit NOT3 n=1 Tax=Sporobolomyces koalae TaxID=500713 RepID=UPI00317C2BC2
MAARKLQTEIDKTLKKVTEGVETFESVYDKIQASSNQTQKEKLETDLKTQIKKLQRLRDQIKTWMASSDVKDKQPLIDNRKLIETQMEKFKACEKEMKTKAFSKEGLSAAAKLDPKEQQKLDLCQWIQTMVEELSRQVEQAEAELETIQGLKSKKKDSEREARLEELDRLNERRSWHINRLELILRLLENGNLQTDSVTNVKDDIAYFVESNTEEDFEEDEGIYDELNLSDEEDMYQIGGDDHQSSHDSVSVADEPAPPVPPIPKTPSKVFEKDDDKPAPPKAKIVPTPQKKPSTDSVSRPPPAAATTPQRSSSGPTPAARTTPAPLPPIRYAAAAAAANVTASPSVTSPAPTSTTAPPPGFASQPSPSAATSPEVSKAGHPPGLASRTGSTAPSPALSSAVPPASQPSPAPSGDVSQQTGSSLSSSAVTSAEPASPAPASASAPSVSSPSQRSQEQPSSAASAAGQTSSAPSNKGDQRLPSSLADLVTSFETAKQKSMRRDNDLGAINQILEAGFPGVPQPLDAEKPKYYVPRTPYATPTYYPQEPSSQFGSSSLFAKLDVDTLFYIFYYCPGTYLQYLAAGELKKQSWRFHKQYLTWFQRANEPTTITETFEQGVYLYFDWEGSWCQRRKTDFKFEYKYLDQY